MRVDVKVKPGSKRPGLSRSGALLVVAVREPALDGRANEAVTRAVAAWLNLSPGRVTIGAASRSKQLAIDGVDSFAYAEALGRL